jgi:IS5 family transposase
MPKQPALPGLRRDQFLAEMNAVVPWNRMSALIERHNPKGWRPPLTLETMLVFFLPNWNALRNSMAEETLYDGDVMRRFAATGLGDERIPYETTILNFRHRLERHGLTEALFAAVNGHLADKGITLRSGTLVDATMIHTLSSTKNKAKSRDPEMSSTMTGNDWFFGIKAHVGVDADSGVAHSLETTTQAPQQPDLGRAHPWRRDLGLGRQGLRQCRAQGSVPRPWQGLGHSALQRPPGAFACRLNCARPRRAGALHPIDAQINRMIAIVRAKVEHPFRMIKRHFGHVKTRYRGLAENRAQLFTLFVLGNLFIVRRRLMA